jgi:hypothetical protein
MNWELGFSCHDLHQYMCGDIIHGQVKHQRIAAVQGRETSDTKSHADAVQFNLYVIFP